MTTRVYAVFDVPILLGRPGERDTREIVFDLKDWINDHGEGYAQLAVHRHGEEDHYLVPLIREGRTAVWRVTEADVAVPGQGGECELSWNSKDGTFVKSETWRTTVLEALNGEQIDAPDTAKAWLDAAREQAAEVQRNAERAEAAADRAENAGGGSGSGGGSGTGPKGEKGDKGDKGDPGEDGEDGITPHIGENGNWFIGETDTGVAAQGPPGEAGAIPDDVADRLETLEDQMADLLYTAIAISSFGHNAGTKEMGDTLTGVTLTWATNKAPTALTLDGEALDVALTSKALTGLSITANKTWTLKATDEREAEATKTTTVSFQNGIYYGAKAVPETIDSAFIMGLGKKELSGTKNRSVSVTGGDGLYFWYAYPKRLGTSLFNIGGFDYEYELETVSFTNSFGYTEDYYVYRSGQYAPASLSVTVKNGG